MKQLALRVLVCAVAVGLTGAAVSCLLLYANHGSVSVRCGLLATATDLYLDGSGRTFQKCSWHLGIGTRTWGETYGFKVRRVYVSLGVRHINPRLSPGEAREDE